MTSATILVVDDARAIRDFVADYVLKPNGYHALMAENGAEALEIAFRDRPDLIISDIVMPGVTGLELARAVRKEWPDLPVILISAEGSEAVVQQALRAGVSDYFIKPFDPDEMLQAIERALARRPARPPTAEAGGVPLLEAAGDAILAVNGEDRVTLLNPAARALFNITRAEVIGQPLIEVLLNSDLLYLLAHDKRAGEVIVASGDTYHALVSPLAGGGQLIVLRDVTPLKTLDRAKSDYVTALAHDLRSPLTGILGYVGLLDKVGPVNERQADYVKRVHASVQNMSALLMELLELDRIEAGYDTLREPLALGELVQRLCREVYEAQAENKQLRFGVNVEEGMPRVLANPMHMRRLISNLLENAIKYTPEHGRVAVHVYPDGDFIVFTVADSGVGIPLEEQARIFERLFRASNVQTDFAGTGLGLSIVKSIVDRHGGRLWVESPPGEGTALTVMLPQHVDREA
jgi:signal transduction histidine kinase